MRRPVAFGIQSSGLPMDLFGSTPRRGTRCCMCAGFWLDITCTAFRRASECRPWCVTGRGGARQAFCRRLWRAWPLVRSRDDKCARRVSVVVFNRRRSEGESGTGRMGRRRRHPDGQVPSWPAALLTTRTIDGADGANPRAGRCRELPARSRCTRTHLRHQGIREWIGVAQADADRDGGGRLNASCGKSSRASSMPAARAHRVAIRPWPHRHAGQRARRRHRRRPCAAADVPLYAARSRPTRSPSWIAPSDTNVPVRRAAPGSPSSRAGTTAHSYLSVGDGTAQRHATWADCERRVKGRSGARFKKALSADDEVAILRGWDIDPGSL